MRLSKKWFNPLYYHLRHYVEDPNIRRIMVFGGKSAAKTFSIAQLFSLFAFKGYSSIAYRKEQATIRTTLNPTFQKAVSTLYLDAAFRMMDFKFETSSTGDIVFKGMDKEGKVKGLEGFRFLMFDELDQFEQDEWMQANLTLRGMPGQKIFATWNPISEDLWIKPYLDKMEWIDLPLFIASEPKYSLLDKDSQVQISKDGKTLLIRTTYLDNKWVVGGEDFGARDENLIHEYETLKNVDELKYTVNVLGKWGYIKTGMEFYPQYSDVKHVSADVHYDPDSPLHITFDFNVKPYITLEVCQIHIGDKAEVHVIKEFCLPHPYSTTKIVSQRFFKDYFEARGHRAGLFFYGDASGKSRTTRALKEDIVHDYDIIKNELREMLSSGSDRTVKVNPHVVRRRDFVIDILAEKVDVLIKIHPECVELRKDFRYLKQSADGGKFKQTVKDDVTDEKYQKYGHTTDAMEYLLCRAFAEMFKRYLR